jgi:hypothetical protein
LPITLCIRLTESDYDALYVVVKEQMLRITREILPLILGQLSDSGVIEITVTDEEVSLRMPKAPQLGVYRVERSRGCIRLDAAGGQASPPRRATRSSRRPVGFSDRIT